MSPDRDEGDELDALVCWAADEVGGLAEVGPSRDRRPPWGLNATEDVAAYREWWRIHNENGSAAEPTGRLRFTRRVHPPTDRGRMEPGALRSADRRR